MLNLIKADLYHIRHSQVLRRSLKGLMILFVLLMLFGINEYGSIGIISMGEAYGYRYSAAGIRGSYAQMVESVMGSTIIIVCIMYFLVGEICCKRYSTRMLGVAISGGQSRVKLYLSNLIAIAATTLILGLGMMLATALMWGIFFSNHTPMTGDEMVQLASVLGTWVMVMLAFVSLWTMIGVWVKDKGVVVILGFIIGDFVVPMVCLGTTMSGSTAPKMPSIMMLDLCGQPMMYTSFVVDNLISFVIIVITTLIGCQMSKRQDIR